MNTHVKPETVDAFSGLSAQTMQSSVIIPTKMFLFIDLDSIDIIARSRDRIYYICLWCFSAFIVENVGQICRVDSPPLLVFRF